MNALARRSRLLVGAYAAPRREAASPMVPVSSDNHRDFDAFSDDELTAFALAADPFAPLEHDAVPWNWGYGFERTLLPEWYMPRPTATARGAGTKVVVGAVVAGLFIIGAFGLCITCGFLSLA